MNERTLDTNEIVRECILEYGRYTLEDRAIADVRDGLKPSQRRILWTMYKMGRGSKAIPVKCASIVGTTLAQVHPHGDQACYDTLINLHWQRYSLISKVGNFGNPNNLIDSGYAAPRYTEARLSEFAERVLDDIEIAPMIKSYTEEHEEPPVLLSRVPLLLINGCSGVAMALSANIPPHNLKEVIEATVHLLDNPDSDTKDLLKFIKGPDYGTGTITSSKQDLLNLYETGLGRVAFVCDYEIEDTARGTKRLVITGLSPGFRKNKFIEDTKVLAEQKLLIAPANDDGSKKSGTRITVEFQDPKIVKDRILPLLRSSNSYQFYCLAGPDRQPKLLGLKLILQKFIEFRRKIESAVLKSELGKVNEREDADRARLAAIDNIKIVIEVLESADTDETAIQSLKNKLSINDAQANVILGLQLRTLMRKLNRSNLLTKIEACVKRRAEINQELNGIDAVVKRRLLEMVRYSDKRGTGLRGGEQDIEDQNNTLYYVGVTQQAKIESFDQLPIKSKAAWNYVDLIGTSGMFVVVSQDNVGQVVRLSYLDKFDSKINQVIGVASEQNKCCVAISKLGSYVAFDPDQRRTKFPIIRTIAEDSLVFACGVNEGDRLLIFGDTATTTLEFDALRITRPNVAPRTIFKRRSITINRVLLIRKDELLVRPNGSEVGSGKIKQDEVVFRIGNQNIIVLQDGRRLQKNQDETLDFLTSGNEVANIVPFSV